MASHSMQTISASEGAVIKHVTQQQILMPFPLHEPPFQAPELPQYFIERPEHKSNIKKRLLSDEAVPGEVLVIHAIHGMGGLGKSTLAALVARDFEIQERFPDGVLWATLGQQPDLLSHLGCWIQALGDHNFRTTDIHAASSYLRSLLQGRAALLVVDDVWMPGHTELFMAGGPNCRMLMTTRETAIARILGITPYEIDTMGREEALELLSKCVGRPLLEGAEKDAAGSLAKAVGFLPLALKLAAARVVNETSWSRLTNELQAEMARLEALDFPGYERTEDESIRKNLSLVASLNLSVRWLTMEERSCFAWLGIVAKNAALNNKMTATLWRTEEDKAGDILRLFHDKALIMSAGYSTGNVQVYRMHDLMHDFACRLLVAPGNPSREDIEPGLGIDLRNAHAALVRQYGEHICGGKWHTLSDDGYIYQHLVRHMELSGNTGEIHLLLKEQTNEGSNAWYQMRDRAGQVAGYLEDVFRAWELLGEQTGKCDEQDVAAGNMGMKVRYALIVASLNSLAHSVSIDLLVALVRKKIWTSARAMEYIRQMPGEGQRAGALIGLAPHLSNRLLREAVELIRLFNDERIKAVVLKRLAPHLPKELLQEASDIAMAIEEGDSRLKTLSGISTHSVSGQLHEVPNEGLIDLYGLGFHDTPLIEFQTPDMPVSTKKDLRRMLKEAWNIRDDWPRAKALVRLAPYMTRRLLHDTFDIAKGMNEDWQRIEALIELAPYLTDTLLEEALSTARDMKGKLPRIRTLVETTPHLAGELQLEVLEIARTSDDVWTKVEILTGLAPRLGNELLHKAFGIAQAINNDFPRAIALSGLAPHLTKELLREALDMASAMKDNWSRAEALACLGSQLPQRLLREALEAARTIEENGPLAKSLSGLAPYVREPRKMDALREATAAALAVEDDWLRAAALADLGPHLKGRLLKEILEAILAIEDEVARAEALVAIAPYLTKVLLCKALKKILSIEDDFTRAGTLASFAPHLCPDLVPVAISIAGTIKRCIPRIKALTSLLPCLIETERTKIVQGALSIALTITNDSQKAEALACLAPCLSNGSLKKAFDAASKIETDLARSKALAGFMQYLNKEQLRKGLSAARGLGDTRQRAEVLAGLALNLSRLPGPVARPFFDELLHSLATCLRRDVLDNIGMLGSFIAKHGGEQAIIDTISAIQDVGRWWK